MTLKRVASESWKLMRTGLVSIAVIQLTLANSFAAETPKTPTPVAPEHLSRSNKTTTPIKHVIVIIGENRSFDHVFATYVPKKKNERVWNLLSEGIVNADGTPGPNFKQVEQKAANGHGSGCISAEPGEERFSE